MVGLFGKCCLKFLDALADVRLRFEIAGVALERAITPELTRFDVALAFELLRKARHRNGEGKPGDPFRFVG